MYFRSRFESFVSSSGATLELWKRETEVLFFKRETRKNLLIDDRTNVFWILSIRYGDLFIFFFFLHIPTMFFFSNRKFFDILPYITRMNTKRSVTFRYIYTHRHTPTYILICIYVRRQNVFQLKND